MKKRNLLFFILILGLLLIYCVQVDNKNREKDTTDSDCGGLRFSLHFQAYEHMIELKKLAEEGNEEKWSRYLAETDYANTGLTEIENINEFFDILGEVKMLYLDENSGWKLVSWEYTLEDSVNMEYGQTDMAYTYEDQIVWFYCYHQEADYPKSSTDDEEKQLAERITIGEYEVNLYISEWDDDENFISGGFQTDNSYVGIRYRCDKETVVLDEALKDNLKIMTLNEIVAENQWNIDETALNEASNIVHAKCIGEEEKYKEYVEYIFEVNEQLKGSIAEETVTVRYYYPLLELENQHEKSVLFEIGQEFVMLISREQDQTFYSELGKAEVSAEEYPDYVEYVQEHYVDCLETTN